MIKQHYRLKVLYAGDWCDIASFDDRDSALAAAGPLAEKNVYSEIQVLEISVDAEKNEVVDSAPLDQEFYLDMATSGESDDAPGTECDIVETAPPPIAEDSDLDQAIQAGIQEIKSAETATVFQLDDLRPVLNLVSIFMVLFLLLVIFEHYEYGGREIIRHLCRRTDLIDCPT